MYVGLDNLPTFTPNAWDNSALSTTSSHLDPHHIILFRNCLVGNSRNIGILRIVFGISRRSDRRHPHFAPRPAWETAVFRATVTTSSADHTRSRLVRRNFRGTLLWQIPTLQFGEITASPYNCEFDGKFLARMSAFRTSRRQPCSGEI